MSALDQIFAKTKPQEFGRRHENTVMSLTRPGSESLTAADQPPIDLWGQLATPPLPRDVLPKIIEDFASINGKQMGVDPAGLVMAALATCAAAIPDRIQIKVKRHSDWTESARLWPALVGDPAAKKTPVINAAVKPLREIDFRLFGEYQDKLRAWEAMAKNERGAPPLARRAILGDTTVEAAQQVFEGTNNGILLAQDELSGWFGGMEKYGATKGAMADRAFWLQAYNGGSYVLNRVGRGQKLLSNVSASLIGGIQPDVIRKLANDSHDDGLLQRINPVILPASSLGSEGPVPPIAKEYSDLILSLHGNVSPANLVQAGNPMTFDAGAQAFRREMEERHFEMAGLEFVNRKLGAHFGKYDGMFARLCLIFHCVDHATTDLPTPWVIAEATARRVGAFMHEFMVPHATAFYGGILGLSDDHDRLSAIANHILAHGLSEISNRDVQRADRAMRKIAAKDIQPLFEQLDTLGWLSLIGSKKAGSPPYWRVNPEVHRLFFERGESERKKRGTTKKLIAEMLGPKK